MEQPLGVISPEVGKGLAAGAVEPFGALGRVMGGQSQEWLADVARAAVGLAPIGPPGVGKALKAGAGMLESGIMRNLPKELFHVVGSDYKSGEPLRSLYNQHGTAAYDKFAERWPEAGDLGQYHAHNVFFYDTMKEAQDHAETFGGKVLKIDPSKIDALKRDKLEVPYGKKSGYWVTDRDVPPEAIVP